MVVEEFEDLGNKYDCPFVIKAVDDIKGFSHAFVGLLGFVLAFDAVIRAMIWNR